MKRDFMRTSINVMLCLALLIALIGTANAQGRRTVLVGSWKCNAEDVPGLFLANYNEGGTFTASGHDLTTSVNYGEWKRTGINTFESQDLAFIYDENGTAEFIQESAARISMPDNDNLTAILYITIYDLDNNKIDEDSVSLCCRRTKIQGIPID